MKIQDIGFFIGVLIGCLICYFVTNTINPELIIGLTLGYLACKFLNRKQ